MPEGPIRRYRELTTSGALTPDAAQRAAVEKLQLLYLRLKSYEPKPERRGVLGLFGFTRRGEGEIDQRLGLYLYGGVGRGKSMLMDLFFNQATIAPKRRAHFHAFMQEAHVLIDAARQQGQEDPIRSAAKAIAKKATLLCFDEMQVNDIADAMIIGRLFQRLFKRGVVVVATSNRHPRDLYKDGLQRERFIPFIDMLQERLDVHHLDGPTDFRLERLRGLTVYHTPLGPDADAAMDAAWAALTERGAPAPRDLSVQGRTVTIPRYLNGVGRFSFEELCGRPLGAADYLAIASVHRTVFIDRIPQLSRANFDAAKRFVTLVDALYEERIHLVCSAAAPPQALYTQGEGSFEFERTVSRLMEMQSEAWQNRL